MIYRCGGYQTVNKKIHFFDTKPFERDFFDAANQRFGFEIRYLTPRLTGETKSLAEGAAAVCAFVNDELDAEVIQRLVDCGVKLVALRCSGYNNVDFKAAYGRLHVVRVPAYSPYAVAEHAMALMLALNRNIPRAASRTREGNFSLNGLMGFDMHGKTLGVVGTGKIGKVLCRIGLGFGMNVIAFDAFEDSEFARQSGVKYMPLQQLFREADIISLHCPLTKDTWHLVNSESIAIMKRGVMIINTSRGLLIDTKALIGALKTGAIGAAGLDVYEEESGYFFEDLSSAVIDDDVLARLLTFPNVLVTSHQAFFTKEALQQIAAVTLQNIADHFEGKPLTNEICYKCGQGECQRKAQGKCF
jgi:D-lactate dehydrogenase